MIHSKESTCHSVHDGNINQIQYFTNNFPLFGFSLEDKAFFQCFREMIENSIDACNTAAVGLKSKNIEITVTRDPHNADIVLLAVMDDGCGMNNPAELLSCFRSTKENSKTVGRFGVGLSICLLYCIERTAQPMSLTSKTIDSKDIFVAKFSISAKGTPQAVQQMSCATNDFISGTKIVMPIPVANVSTCALQRGMLPSVYKNIVVFESDRSIIISIYNPSYHRQLLS
jgi:DNA topoisomerase VI subunit B